MRRILLTLPRGSAHYDVPPLGLLYLAGALRAAGHEVVLHDPARADGRPDAFARALTDVRPDVVGISACSQQLTAALALARTAQTLRPGALRVLGGPHVSAVPAVVGRSGGLFHHGVVGEGERPLTRLVTEGDGGGGAVGPPAIPGVVSAAPPAGGPRAGQPVSPWYEADLDALPLPAWDLAPPASYRGAPQGFVFRRRPIAPLLTSRGCPYGCSFCGSAAVMGRRRRVRSVDSVLAEVELLVRRFGVRELHIVDDTFTTDRARAIALCRALAPFRLALAFPNGLRIDTLDPELLAELRRAGTHAMSLGIESGSQRVLDSVTKGTRIDQIRRAVGWVRAAGIDAGGFFILGFPGESLAEMQATVRFARELGLSRAHFSAFLPLPGTRATRRLLATGELDPEAAADLAYHAVPYAPRGLTTARLKRLQREAFLRFYLRPAPLLRLLGTLRSPAHLRAFLARARDYLGGPPAAGRHG